MVNDKLIFKQLVSIRTIVFIYLLKRKVNLHTNETGMLAYFHIKH